MAGAASLDLHSGRLPGSACSRCAAPRTSASATACWMAPAAAMWLSLIMTISYRPAEEGSSKGQGEKAGS